MSLYVNIKKKFQDFALSVCFEATNEEVFGVLGESGGGKSLTLKCIAGIETPDEGQIRLNNRIFFDSEKGINLSPQERNVGYLFQNYALFPNMTAEQNIGIGVQKKERKRKVAYYIDKFQLKDVKDKYPFMLSGGQQQRVALARMLVTEPEILLLDEPFSAVDSYLKWQLEQEIWGVLEYYKGPVLFVSHNRDEVYRLCNRLGIMQRGEVVVLGEKKEVFAQPKSVAAALLTGCKNIGKINEYGDGTCAVWGMELPFPKDMNTTQKRFIGVRAHSIELYQTAEENRKAGKIERVLEMPFDMIYIINIGEKNFLRVELEKRRAPQLIKGDIVFIRIPPEKILYLKE